MNAHQRRVNQRRFERYWDLAESRVKANRYNTDVEFYRPYVLWNPETGQYLDRLELFEGTSHPWEWTYHRFLSLAEVRYCFDAHEKERLSRFQDRFPGVTYKKLTAIEYGKNGTALNRAIKDERKKRKAHA